MTTTNEQPIPIQEVILRSAMRLEELDRETLGLPAHGGLSEQEIEQAHAASMQSGDQLRERRAGMARQRLLMLRSEGKLTLAPPPPPAWAKGQRPVMSTDLPPEPVKLPLVPDPAPLVVQLTGFSSVRFAPAPGTTTFPLTTTGGHALGYLSPQHIHVYVDDGNGEVELTRPSQWDFDSTGTAVMLESPTVAGQTVHIRRHTPLQPLTIFQRGTLLGSDQLNAAVNQCLYVVQEMSDRITPTSPSS
jgi:hypothetical protein